MKEKRELDVENVHNNAALEEKTPVEDDSYYDFMAFLDLMKNPDAEPIVKYTKSFLYNFHHQRANWTSDEQVKLVNDFKVFIYDKFTTNSVFAALNIVELRNAKEGMEKLLMGKLYLKCFSPCLKESNATIDGSHESDTLQDAKLANKIEEFSFLSPEHFEILPSLINSKLDKFVALSAKELSNINNYKSPRDKMVCILNCCKVLFGLLKQTKANHRGADHFLPLLIFTVLRANVQNLFSNINYIERFRFPDFLQGESAYYLSTLQGAVNFVLDMDRDSLHLYEGEAMFNQKYNENADRLTKLRQETQKITELNKDAGTLQNRSHVVHSSSPSDYILKPLDDAASTVVNKLNKILAPSTSHMESPDGSNGSDLQEIDEQSAAKIGRKMEERDHKNTIQTLKLMFPALDEELIDDVCVASKFRVGVCVDALLEMAG